jgi:hypothetical protein
MRKLVASALALGIAAGTWGLQAQAPDPARHKTALVQWVSDGPPLVYDVRFTGGDTTMPTALKYLIKDLAESEGWHLTGQDKSKVVASQAKRIALDYTPARSKPRAVRAGQIEINEQPDAIHCVVTFAKKPGKDEVSRTGEVLETFGRKYLKVAKTLRATVEAAEASRANMWSFGIRFKDAAAKDKKANPK